MLTAIATKLTMAYLAYASTHSGMVFETYKGASMGADVYSCDIELTPVQGQAGSYGAPYTLIDCSK